MKIYTISHKPLKPCVRAPLVPLYVGGLRVDGAQSDDTGISIADKNSSFCELTAQYWVWKNAFAAIADDEPVGFCHYRRIFTCGADVVSEADMDTLAYDRMVAPLVTGEADVLLSDPVKFRAPRNAFKNYRRFGRWVSRGAPISLYEQYRWKHRIADLEALIGVLPAAHRTAFRDALNGDALISFNMYIAKKSVLDAYFSLLFPALFALEDILSARYGKRRWENFISRFSRNATMRYRYQHRVYGFLAERFASYYFLRQCRPAFTPMYQLDLSRDGGA